MTAAMTQVGTVLGTAAYMSPEQARGKEVDRRADIWAFGVILFEMLTGKQVFVGETASDTLAGILKSEPDWSRLPDNVPFQVERVLRRCLAKDPRQRLRDIGEARVRLEDPDAESGMFSGPISTVAESGGSRLGRMVPWVLAAVSLAAVGWLLWGPGGGSGDGALHLALPAPAEADFHIIGSYPGLPEISPDGNLVAFTGRHKEDQTNLLYVRGLGDPAARALADTKDAQYPFWSPDGMWLAYYDRNQGLFKVPVNGGPPQLICAAGNGKGGSWNQADDILLTADYNSPILTVKAYGGEPRQVTDLAADEGFNSHRHPQFMPDGQHFIYLARGSGKRSSEIRFANLDGGAAKVVTTNSFMGYYASGNLVYISHGNLVAQPFDPKTGTLSGVPTPLAIDVLEIVGAARGAFSVSTEGSLVYLRGQATQEGYLTWRERDGKITEQVGDPATFWSIALSPDSRSAVASIIDPVAGTGDLWIVDLERKFLTRFTTDPADDYYPVWSPDSRGIYFLSDRETGAAVYYKELGSSDPPRQLYARDELFSLCDVTADGRTIIYSALGEDSNWDLWSAVLDGETEPRLLRQSQSVDDRGILSPDGTWLAFTSGESGQYQIYVTPWPAMTPITQVSTTSGFFSAWSRNGRELIFQETEGQMMAVSMTQEDGRMRVGPPELLFEIPGQRTEDINWAVTADGERFLTVNTQEAEIPSYCHLILDWPELLKQR